MQNQRAQTGKNARSKQRNADRRRIKREAAEARQKVFDRLPEDEKSRRRESKTLLRTSR